jgi:hypothetical protein
MIPTKHHLSYMRVNEPAGEQRTAMNYLTTLQVVQKDTRL